MTTNSETFTDSTNVLTDSNNDVRVTDNNLPQESTTDVQTFDDPESPTTQTEETPRPVYEVVFFAKYKHFPRPSAEELTNYFSTYGEVHHVVCPMNAIFAFIFMTRLNTDVELRRTRTTISQIIKDMDPNKRFHITVASNKRSKPRHYPQSTKNDASDNHNSSPDNNKNASRGRAQYGRGRGRGRGGRGGQSQNRRNSPNHFNNATEV